MTTTSGSVTITDEFVAALADRARQAEELRKLPADTIRDATDSGLLDLLIPRRFGGLEAPYPEILDHVRRLAHGCTSSAWTLGFYTLHGWITALFDEQAQQEAFADRPYLAPAPLAPTGTAEPRDGGFTLSGRWSWATGIMQANWVMVGAIVTGDKPDAILALLPVSDARVEDVWHTDGMRATGSNDVVVENAFVPSHRTIRVRDLYAGRTPGAALHDSPSYRWPMVPALALLAAMPALGTAERVADLYATRLSERVLAYQMVKQKDKPAARIRLGDARIRLRALRALLDGTVATIEGTLAAGETVDLRTRAQARLAAARIVHESKAVIGSLLEASGASVHFLDHPMQRARRDVDVLSGHVVFDHDEIREITGSLEIGMEISPFAMV
ncbi:Flavin-dependent monooxygenase, oxygenase subunit HsaA [Gordonia paraffinivorans]|uniref:Flavin-dependent monooxygenase, oxygenase subunit HsaA n=1 Tax=Gordonia paraffinivorans TaxID=175628 RepID=A0ABD7V7R8_9ACTN|nr:acyl-CoA dehydrogenase family protein [Gordonia paraffinivorans]VFA90287.1 Flavin-dependent monooxygenase, oxygenase subunit HsaA [Gordonia paraffinivorans]